MCGEAFSSCVTEKEKQQQKQNFCSDVVWEASGRHESRRAEINIRKDQETVVWWHTKDVVPGRIPCVISSDISIPVDVIVSSMTVCVLYFREFIFFLLFPFCASFFIIYSVHETYGFHDNETVNIYWFSDICHRLLKSSLSRLDHFNVDLLK